MAFARLGGIRNAHAFYRLTPPPMLPFNTNDTGSDPEQFFYRIGRVMHFLPFLKRTILLSHFKDNDPGSVPGRYLFGKSGCVIHSQCFKSGFFLPPARESRMMGEVPMSRLIERLPCDQFFCKFQYVECVSPHDALLPFWLSSLLPCGFYRFRDGVILAISSNP